SAEGSGRSGDGMGTDTGAGGRGIEVRYFSQITPPVRTENPVIHEGRNRAAGLSPWGPVQGRQWLRLGFTTPHSLPRTVRAASESPGLIPNPPEQFFRVPCPSRSECGRASGWPRSWPRNVRLAWCESIP